MHVQGKTEAMYIPHQLSAYDTADTSNIPVASGFVPFSLVFRYLGANIHHSLSDEYDVLHRIASAGATICLVHSAAP